jgi:hypothetical protein
MVSFATIRADATVASKIDCFCDATVYTLVGEEAATLILAGLHLVGFVEFDSASFSARRNAAQLRLSSNRCKKKNDADENNSAQIPVNPCLNREGGDTLCTSLYYKLFAILWCNRIASKILSCPRCEFFRLLSMNHEHHLSAIPAKS